MVCAPAGYVLRMSYQIFLQRFQNEQAAPVPYKPLTAYLARFGTLAHVDGDLELKFLQQDVLCQAGIEGRVLVVGNETSGVQCLAIESSRTGEAAARFYFGLMQVFDFALFDDQLNFIYLKQGSRCLLPEAMLSACASGVRRVAHHLQLWPEALRLPSRSSDHARLMPFTAIDGSEQHQRIDSIDDHNKVFRYFLDTHPATLNAGVARAGQHLMARLERVALQHRPGRLEVMFNYQDSFLPILEAPRVGQTVAPLVTVTPPPHGFGGEATLNPLPQFRASHDADSTARYNGHECQRWAASEFGIRLAGDAASVEQLQQLLEAVRQRMQSIDQAQAAQLVAKSGWHIGSYWGELIRREVGAQWGYLELFNGRYALLRSYRGRLLFPLLDVTEWLAGGELPSLSGKLAELRSSLRSASLDHMDFVGDIPMHLAMLFGRVFEGFEHVPFQAQLPVAEFDLSLNSLHSLDRWLRHIGPQRKLLSDGQMIGVMHSAAVYLGEVMREQFPGDWQWENYHDYFDGSPGLPEVEFHPTTAAVLRGSGRLLFPASTIGQRLVDEDAPDLYSWVVSTYREIDPDWSPARPARLCSDDVEAHRLVLPANEYAAACERLQGICADTDYAIDGSLESVTEVDRFVDAIRERCTGRPDANATELLTMLAIYTGEQLVRTCQTRWRSPMGTRLEGETEANLVLQTRYGGIVDPLSAVFARARSARARRLESLCLNVRNEFDLRQRFPAPVIAERAAGAVSPRAKLDPALVAKALASADQIMMSNRSAAISPERQSQLRIGVLLGPVAAMAVGAGLGWFAGLVTLAAISGGAWWLGRQRS